MCIDFKDLNKACPKDNYPLPEIDLKVESLHAFPYKCFLDEARGYHQIPMAKEDADKTAFHTGKGIQANPKKIAAIENMTAPKTVKEMQSLTGKLAALTRFLSKAAERQLLFFKTLKGCLKQKSFVWTSEAETAFQEMKKLLKTLPTLITPIDGETLYLYISVANEAFGSVLVAERDKIQKHVYFVSKALTGSEINYAPIEKFVYALILTSRRLRRYFQGHPVHVLTNMTVKQVLTKPEISGRLALWAVELGAYQISYLPRSAVKGQVLADYLAEMTGELEVINERIELKPAIGETWDLFTDGASCAEGAGEGLVLASPSGEEHTYALRFNFDVTNNEAEYEALLAGLNIARKMDITKLRVFIDSQLVANQFNVSFEAHDSSMQKYLQLLKEMAVRFEHFELAQVPRSQNKKADALCKLSALTFSHFQKQVWVEELPSKSIDNDLMVASVVEEQPNWMEPILQYIRSDILPSDKREACLVRERAPMYIIQNDILYRKSYFCPMMRCVGPIEAEMIIDEVHNGSCALHSGYKTIAVKIMRMGYFWPSLYGDVAKIVKRCKSCQRHAPQNRMPRHDMIPVNSPCDNGAQIVKDPFKTWCTDLNIIQKFSSVMHPQANGLCEVTNRDIVSGIKKRLCKKRTGWVDELPNVLWVHRTTFKMSTGETPFSLVYGSEAVIPAEILVPTHRVANYEEDANDNALGENLNFIEERRLMAAIIEANNKQQIAKYYNKRVRALSFDIGE
ncbi:uncharacterized protein [Rutidosis leptorrhynchoides]|uniref:uncharacterized protein n=1 Tax=Rutidosis leptorrhynchoides TaxID=125765 RepID=UPI003A993FEE